MCLELLNPPRKFLSKKPQHLTATEDIVVYKLLLIEDDKLISPHRRFVWKTGKLYKTKFGFQYPDDYHVQINEGFHAYRYYELAKENSEYLGSVLYIFEAIIPKGAKYYCDAFEIVSNKLIIKQHVPNN